uniref:Solute carrier family 13 member 2 n=1 Tax=Ditylenchus dipsaci TaxID=166011 RepID=A0A915E0T1_9BILA
MRTQEALCAFVVILMGFLWMTETLPLAVTGLIPLVFYPLFGIVTAKEVSREYFTDTNFIFMGSLIMAIAVEITNLHERVALRVLLFTGTSPRWLMLGFQLATCLISMWITNTATTAMMLPILLRVISELEKCYRVQKAQMASTSITSITLSENFINGQPENPFSPFQRLLLSVAYTASIGGTGTLVGTAPNLILADAINSYYPKSSPLSFSNWMLFAIPGMFLMTLFCWLWLQFLFIGFKRQDKDAEKAVHHLLQKKYENLGPISYSEGSVMVCFILQVFIWVTRHPGFVPGWGDLFLPGFREPVFGVAPDWPVPAILTWADMQSRFSWSTIILLGGSFAMAKGVNKSGLSDLFGHELRAFEDLPDWLFVSMAAVLATALTEFSSNVATASLFIPILTSIAKAHSTNPMHYLFPIAISCSFAFMFPAGTPPMLLYLALACSKSLICFALAACSICLDCS